MTKNDDAVSPVVGIILTVAIVIILAALIASFIFGVAGHVDGCITEKTITVESVCENYATYQIIKTTDGGVYNVVGLAFTGYSNYLKSGRAYNVTINSNCEIIAYRDISPKPDCTLQCCCKRCSC